MWYFSNVVFFVSSKWLLYFVLNSDVSGIRQIMKMFVVGRSETIGRVGPVLN